MNPSARPCSVGSNLLFGSLLPAKQRTPQTELARRLKSQQASATAGLGIAFVWFHYPGTKLNPLLSRSTLEFKGSTTTGNSQGTFSLRFRLIGQGTAIHLAATVSSKNN